MRSRIKSIRTRLPALVVSLTAVIVCIPAAAMNTVEDGRLDVTALLGVLVAVLVLGLYVQSTRRRTI